jgi:phosphatidylinositol-3-phosphatase
MLRVTDAKATSVTSSAFALQVDPTTRPFRHVVVVVLENHNYDAVLGNPAVPWLNQLLSRYSLAAQYYGNTHPSIGNYFMLATGQVLSNDSNQIPATFPVMAPNIVQSLLNAGRSWKSYAEGLPTVGYLGGNDVANKYAVRHNPFAYLAAVQSDVVQQQNLVPFSQFAADWANGSLPDYSFVSPDLCNSGHDCSLDITDTWLGMNFQPLLQDASFKDDSLLVIVFDEASDTDVTLGGGRVVAAIVAPAALSQPPGFVSNSTFQHESLLRLSLEALGVKDLPGQSATAKAMWEFFRFSPPTGLLQGPAP